MKVDVKLTEENIRSKDFATLMQDAIKEAFRWDKPVKVNDKSADFHCCSSCNPKYSIAFHLYPQVQIVKQMQAGTMSVAPVTIQMYAPDTIYL